MRFGYLPALCCVFQSLCTTMCLPSGKPSGQPSASLPVTLSSLLPWRWWKSTETSSWRTTWTSQTSLSSSMVRRAASRQMHANVYHSKHLLLSQSESCSVFCALHGGNVKDGSVKILNKDMHFAIKCAPCCAQQPAATDLTKPVAHKALVWSPT